MNVVSVVDAVVCRLAARSRTQKNVLISEEGRNFIDLRSNDAPQI
jgi:hypothetical protein